MATKTISQLFHDSGRCLCSKILGCTLYAWFPPRLELRSLDHYRTCFPLLSSSLKSTIGHNHVWCAPFAASCEMKIWQLYARQLKQLGCIVGIGIKASFPHAGLASLSLHLLWERPKHTPRYIMCFSGRSFLKATVDKLYVFVSAYLFQRNSCFPQIAMPRYDVSTKICSKIEHACRPTVCCALRERKTLRRVRDAFGVCTTN
jgi:hypothetical protein